MDLQQLQTQLETIGTVNGLEIINDVLYISITNFIDPIQSSLDFINIASTLIIPHYPNMVTFLNESGSIKSIFNI